MPRPTRPCCAAAPGLESALSGPGDLCQSQELSPVRAERRQVVLSGLPVQQPLHSLGTAESHSVQVTATCCGRAHVVPARPSCLQAEVTASGRTKQCFPLLAQCPGHLGPSATHDWSLLDTPAGLPRCPSPGLSSSRCLLSTLEAPSSDGPSMRLPRRDPEQPVLFPVASSRPRPWSVPAVLILAQAAGRCPRTLQAAAWGRPPPAAERRPSPRTAALLSPPP